MVVGEEVKREVRRRFMVVGEEVEADREMGRMGRTRGA